MFHRRKRSASAAPRNVVPPASASAPAQSAATQAFLASKPSTSNLQESAAAAALKATSRAPTPVSGVETKRMVQRQGRGLNRRSSSGSMTERTFRTPSPSHSAQGLDDASTPPVPPLPSNFNGGLSQRRAASMEPLLRMTSPPVTGKGARAGSLDRSNIATPKSRPQHRPKPPGGDQLERSSSQSSINFSYPTAIRPNSPPIPDHTPVGKVPTSVSSSRQGAGDFGTNLNNTAEKVVREKQSKASTGSSQGRHLTNEATRSQLLGDPPDEAQGIGESNNAHSRQTDQHKQPAKGSDTGSTPQESIESVGDACSSLPVSKVKRAQRASGSLTKQPSIVREDWDGERGDSAPGAREHSSSDYNAAATRQSGTRRPKKEIAAPNSSKKMIETQIPSAEPAGSPSHLVANSSASKPQAAEAPVRAHLEVDDYAIRPGRQTSISPSRSTRFSAQLASEFSGRPRHEPLGRSVSPAKSALKHHSPSPQPASPTDGGVGTRWQKSSQASSEASDNTSLLSADGSGLRPQFRKSLRVSFEADPESADADVSGVAIQQHKDPVKRSRAGKSPSGLLDAIPAEDDMEEFFKPRPALPSFGSVRRQREDFIEHSGTPGDAPSLASSGSSVASNLASFESLASREPVNGKIKADRARELRAETRGHPLEPARLATSSDMALAAVTASPEGFDVRLRTTSATKTTPETASPIPSIAVQPATPGVESTKPGDEWLVEVPGSFPELSGQEGPSAHPLVAGGDSDALPPHHVSIFEPTPLHPSLLEEHQSGQPDSTYDVLRQQERTESDTESNSSSIYSDAAEDLSDVEGDGFGSINAIIESPGLEASTQNLTTPPDSPLGANVGNHKLSRQAEPQTWDKVGAHWKSFVQIPHGNDLQGGTRHVPLPERSRKKKAGPGSFKSTTSYETDEAILPRSRPRNVPQSSARSAEQATASLSGPGKFKKSMRAQLEETGSAPSLKSSMRANQPAGSQTVSQSPTVSSTGMRQKKLQTPPSGQSQVTRSTGNPESTHLQGLRKTPQRKTSAGSDSSSSFRKVHRPTSSGGRSTMRTSMRNGGASSVAMPKASRAAVRSVSPPTRRPFSAVGEERMRRSMRDSGDVAAPSLRNTARQRPSSSLSGLVKPKSKVKAPAPASSTSRFKSRFVDSDDDEPSAQKFSSRFEDSSDDGREASTLRPVRGIPRKVGGDDSTDLEDSSDDGEKRGTSRRQRTPRSFGAANATNGRAQGKPHNAFITAPPSPVVETKKKGIFGRFRSGKSASPASPASPTPPVSPDKETELHPSQIPERISSPQNVSFPDSRGKLQRKNVTRRVTGDSWPLPAKSSLDEDRLKTSGVTTDNNTSDQHPDSGQQRDASHGLGTKTEISPLRQPEKKKRFPLLRKALRL